MKSRTIKRGLVRVTRRARTRAMQQALRLLPREWRHDLFRSYVSVHPTIPPELTCRLARTQTELEAAFRILHDAYVSMGFMKPQASGLRITLFHALPSTSTLIALWKGEVIGTVSIIRDSVFGLPLDRIFNLTSLRQKVGRIAEYSALAIRRDYRGNRGEILFPLLKFCYEYTAQYLGVENIVITTHPDRAEFYQALLFFNELEKTVVDYDYVDGNPAKGFYLNMTDAYPMYATYYGRKAPGKNLFRFFLSKTDNFHFPERKYFKISDPIMTPHLLDYFFNQKTDLFSRLTPQEMSHLSQLYTGPAYKRVFRGERPVDPALCRRREPRFEVQCRARICRPGGEKSLAWVREVSREGIRLRVPDGLKAQTEVSLQVEIGDFEIAECSGTAIWKEGEQDYGLQLSGVSRNWGTFINYLQGDLRRVAAAT